MNTIHRLTFAAALAALCSTSAWAADPPKPAASVVANGASVPSAKALAKICAQCGIVIRVHTETRKGKATGVGAVGGAVLGGVLGNQVGGGTGKTVTTIGGAAAGGLIGNEIEKRMHKHTVWITEVTMKDGKPARFEATTDPQLRAGDVVAVENGQMKRQTN